MRWTAALLVFSCGCAASAPPPPAPMPPESPEPASPPVVSEPAPRAHVDTVLKEMLCQGPCPPQAFAPEPAPDVELTLVRPWPPYRVTVRSDGQVVFAGLPFEGGRVVDQVSPAEAKELVRKFETAGFSFNQLGMSMDWSPMWSPFQHVPATTLSLVRGRRLLTVTRSHFGGAAFPLADEIERVTGARGRMRCGAPSLPPCDPHDLLKTRGPCEHPLRPVDVGRSG